LPCAKSGRGLEAEVEGRRQPAGGRVLRRERRVRVEDLAEHEEVVVAAPDRLAACRSPARTSARTHVDVLDGVDAEAVDAEVDPRLVDVDHAVATTGLLGEQVVQTDEVAVRRVSPAKVESPRLW
jgi:hypothetical protein